MRCTCEWVAEADQGQGLEHQGWADNSTHVESHAVEGHQQRHQQRQRHLRWNSSSSYSNTGSSSTAGKRERRSSRQYTVSKAWATVSPSQQFNTVAAALSCIHAACLRSRPSLSSALPWRPARRRCRAATRAARSTRRLRHSKCRHRRSTRGRTVSTAHPSPSHQGCTSQTPRPTASSHPHPIPPCPTCEEAHGQLRDDEVLERDVGLAVARPPVKRRRQEIKGAAEHAALLRQRVGGWCGPRSIVSHTGQGGTEHTRR